MAVLQPPVLLTLWLGSCSFVETVILPLNRKHILMNAAFVPQPMLEHLHMTQTTDPGCQSMSLRRQGWSRSPTTHSMLLIRGWFCRKPLGGVELGAAARSPPAPAAWAQRTLHSFPACARHHSFHTCFMHCVCTPRQHELVLPFLEALILCMLS